MQVSLDRIRRALRDSGTPKTAKISTTSPTMKKEIIRTSFDLTLVTLDQADGIVKEVKLSSRKAAVEWSIQIATKIIEAQRQGLRLMLVGKDGEKREFSLNSAKITPRKEERLITTQISRETAYQLLAVANNPTHPDAARKAILELAMVACAPEGPQEIPASLLFQLIYWAIRSNEPGFLTLTRDIVTSCCTRFESFAALLAEEPPTWNADPNRIEQQFLTDEYKREKCNQLVARLTAPTGAYNKDDFKQPLDLSRAATGFL